MPSGRLASAIRSDGCCTRGMDIAGAIERGDLDELQRVVDGCCAARDWDALVELRDRATRAFERGHQLWPTAASAEYRLALEAPPEFAALVLVEGTGHFALGPLAEVAASTHTWEQLAPHVAHGPLAVIALHERAVRGEDCSDGPLPGPPVLTLARRLASWEPSYPVATYRADRGEFPAPDLPTMTEVSLPTTPPTGSDDPVTEALAALAAAWSTGSEAAVSVAAVDGDAADAIAALGVTSARAAVVDPTDAVASMAWAAASGGAFGRRRGAAAGRFDAWWVLATLADVDLDHIDPEDLGEEAAAFEYRLWDRGGPVRGWELRLAVTDPHRGRSWVVEAVDRDPTMRP